MATVQEVLEAMKGRFDESAATGQPLTFQFDVPDDKPYHAAITDGALEIAEGAPTPMSPPDHGQRNLRGHAQWRARRLSENSVRSEDGRKLRIKMPFCEVNSGSIYRAKRNF